MARKKILDLIESVRDEIIDVTKELIKIPTVNPPGESYWECVKLVKSQLDDVGIKTSIIEVPRERLHELSPLGGELPRPNVLGTLEGTIGRPILHFNMHYDVVPPGEGWTITDPFEPKIVDGKLYGRGACDSKGGYAPIMMALKAIIESGVKLKGNLVVSITCDEETGGAAGLRYLLNEGYLKGTDYAVLSEAPMTGFSYHLAHKGDLWLEITVKGKSVHSSLEFKGVNAFIKATKVALALENELKLLFKKKGPTKWLTEPEEARYATICIGGVAKGGVKENIVPGEFKFSIDRRVLPEETIEEACREIDDVISRLKEEDPQLDLSIKTLLEWLPAETPIDNPLCKAMDKVLTELGQPTIKGLATYSTNMGYLTKGGIPSILYGPGNIEQAHIANEYCPVEDIILSTKVLALLAIDLLGTE